MREEHPAPPQRARRPAPCDALFEPAFYLLLMNDPPSLRHDTQARDERPAILCAFWGTDFRSCFLFGARGKRQGRFCAKFPLLIALSLSTACLNRQPYIDRGLRSPRALIVPRSLRLLLTRHSGTQSRFRPRLRRFARLSRVLALRFSLPCRAPQRHEWLRRFMLRSPSPTRCNARRVPISR